LPRPIRRPRHHPALTDAPPAIFASSSSFWAAQHDADKSRTGLGMMDRQRLKMWLRDAYQQIDTAPV
jgi:hypothetical protein